MFKVGDKVKLSDFFIKNYYWWIKDYLNGNPNNFDGTIIDKYIYTDNIFYKIEYYRYESNKTSYVFLNHNSILPYKNKPFSEEDIM